MRKMYIATIIEYITKQLKDIMFYNLAEKKVLPHDVDIIIIDATIFLKPYRILYNYKRLETIMQQYTGKRVILLTHDLHDWSFSRNIKYDKNNLVPILHETPDKKDIYELIKSIGVTDLIFYYYAPQSEYFKKYLNYIDRFYVIDHAIDNTIFNKRPNRTYTKKYDILFYSSHVRKAYPVRYRLLDICKKMGLIVKVIDYHKGIRGKKLSDLINQSWIVIACTLTYSYFVQKFIEIPASFSVVLGDANKQVHRSLGRNMIYVDPDEQDDKIKEKIKRYLEHPELLVYMSSVGHRMMHRTHTYKNYAKSLLDVINNPETSQYLYDDTMIGKQPIEPKPYNSIEIHLKKTSINLPEGDYLITTPESNFTSIDFDADDYVSVDKKEYYIFHLDSDKMISFKKNNKETKIYYIH